MISNDQLRRLEPLLEQLAVTGLALSLHGEDVPPKLKTEISEGALELVDILSKKHDPFICMTIVATTLAGLTATITEGLTETTEAHEATKH